MAVTPGTRLGAYEIVGLLGAGGMGEVYRAVDTRLDRQVAIKVLPEAVRADPERTARFEREAKLLASLNHPNIAGIYGLERANDEQFIVMELVEGETLADQIARGPIPVPEALQIAKQIADALEAAHEAGVIHRDLKPANVKVRPDGTVKVLDFGLAKALTGDPLTSPASLTNSPTITSPVGVTGVGMLLGTAAYMSPEQAKGKAADKRSDVWAFGCVLYEMLTGIRAFGREDVPETLADVLRVEPAWQALPQQLSPTLEAFLRRCLHKDPKQRLGDIRDMRLALEGAFDTDAGRAASVGSAATGAIFHRRVRLAWGVAALASVAALAVTLLNLRQVEPTTDGAAAVRFEVQTSGSVSALALSPDGGQVAFISGLAPTSHIWLRRLDSMDTRMVQGTEDARGDPFWSPDGRFLAFFTTTALKTIDVTAGAPPQTICRGDVCGNRTRGGTWNEDGVILIGGEPGAGASVQERGGLLRIPASGGAPVVLTTLDESRGELSHEYPQFLPDGTRFLFLAVATAEQESGIYIGSLDSQAAPVKVLATNKMARYADGHLLFGRADALMAQPFDIKALTFVGEAVRVAEGMSSSSMAPNRLGFAVSRARSLTYVSSTSTLTQLRWLDRSGARLSTLGEPDEYQNPVVSPDGKLVAFERAGDIWIIDSSGGSARRLTTHAAADRWPIWSADGSHVVFASYRDGRDGLYQKPAGGTQTEQLLLETPFTPLPFNWSADGRFLSFSTVDSERSYDMWILPMSGERHALSFRATPAYEGAGVVSPNGRWIAYHSNANGAFQIYVESVPSQGTEWQITTSGGSRPRWRRDGRELYYVSPGNEVMAVEIDTTRDSVDFGVPRGLFQVPFREAPIQRNVFDVTADGQRFLVNASAGARAGSITWVLNWHEELKRLVPTK
jgi:Tol biopolymer transport system component/predicted Ser/Thr protein kinase